MSKTKGKEKIFSLHQVLYKGKLFKNKNIFKNFVYHLIKFHPESKTKKRKTNKYQLDKIQDAINLVKALNQ